MCKADIHHPNWDLAAFALNRQKEKKKNKKKKGGKEAAQAKEEEEQQQQFKYGIASLRSGCVTGTGHVVAARNILECEWQRGEMTAERLGDGGQRPISVWACSRACIAALLFLSFLNLLLSVLARLCLYTTLQICSALTWPCSLDQSSGHLMERMVKLVCTCPKLV